MFLKHAQTQKDAYKLINLLHEHKLKIYITFYSLSVPAEPPAPTCIVACLNNFLPSDMISGVTTGYSQIVIPSWMQCHL